MQLTNMVRLGSINIAFWLCHEDSFMEITIQKGVININMLNGTGSDTMLEFMVEDEHHVY